MGQLDCPICLPSDWTCVRSKVKLIFGMGTSGFSTPIPVIAASAGCCA